MFKKLLTALLIANALHALLTWSNLNSRDCKNTYICKGYGIIKNSNTVLLNMAGVGVVK
ncbi:hypothetical protein H8356DRAFT_1359181 [Neocallimastix lanati (nom. inval.)]|nr:hypothetical protein H8356DRAFT_1359181 [Neocallimastix sp. JGI-2020a]